jgi:hypothetical protein
MRTLRPAIKFWRIYDIVYGGGLEGTPTQSCDAAQPPQVAQDFKSDVGGKAKDGEGVRVFLST